VVVVRLDAYESLFHVNVRLAAMSDKDMDEVWNADVYPDLVRAEVPDYDRVQDEVVAATRGRAIATILELGPGTGETSRRLLDAHPGARLVGVDSSELMLKAARDALDPARVDLRLQRLEDPLPEGPFDLVAAVFSVHHLRAEGKADLFARIAGELAAGGRFVLADVILPDDPSDVVTPMDEGFDFADSVDDQLAWLRAAGLEASVAWAHRDLAVMVAERA
jgi:tRNA (cmo5U34)-methyltransferase